jgi:hypothetical protein
MTQQTMKLRYGSFDQFWRVNQDKFVQIQNATKELKSPVELGMTGQALLEAEKLAFRYLNLKSMVNDLMLGLSGSVLDAKANIKNQYGIAYREMSGSIKEREHCANSDTRGVEADQVYNDLDELQSDLEGKLSDYESAHYYYKKMTQGD